ncbi:MAG: hypothetical protein CL438_08665, partial [Acidimicrobiaceae bacterium]|nr:hypothetical protein [Acidimicrobiaceae bacterium]
MLEVLQAQMTCIPPNQLKNAERLGQNSYLHPFKHQERFIVAPSIGYSDDFCRFFQGYTARRLNRTAVPSAPKVIPTVMSIML